MEQITIKDEDDFKAFIDAQSKSCQRACDNFIASRVALRGAPYANNFFEFRVGSEGRQATSIFIWRRLLLSGIAAWVQSRDITPPLLLQQSWTLLAASR